ncbi:hypothetical protein NIIDNTM18_35200 [Mycolicibacterium litorale]|uniref:Uncharacterized protein n=1 Tax=Mycolicibacterium litorale TaxID=758802 RepID=A0A6S6P7Z7_9MYCO|nr:hypothetical protein [Mycolicibacterium litorale]BCI54242.1 hypothetical protein NIIDNTM18_35200 [Mycolicibacterium litorale]
MRGIIGVIVLVWLLIGVVAAFQRDYFKTGDANCATAARVALTVVAGPLNYMGVNPKVDCNVNVPEPSAGGVSEMVDRDVDLEIGVPA